MAATKAGSAIVCTGTTTVAGPHNIVAIGTAATTSATITDGTTEFFSCGAEKAVHALDLRVDSVTVTVTGGGYVTLYLKSR
jgi:hypothetical protein